MSSRHSWLVEGTVAACLGLGALKLYTVLRREHTQPSGVQIIDTAQALETYCREVLQTLDLMSAADEPIVGGLDTEWSGKQAVELLQLAVLDAVLLIRPRRVLTNSNSSTFGQRSALRQLLLHPKLIFSGSAVGKDVQLVREQYGLEVRLAVDLQLVARKELRELPYGCGLAGLAKQLLDVTMNKDDAIRCGDWTVDVFDKQQLSYAVDDAIYSRDVLLEMFKRKSDKSLTLNNWLDTVMKPVIKTTVPKQTPDKQLGRTAKGKPSLAAVPKTIAERIAKLAVTHAAFSRAREFYTLCVSEGETQLVNLLDEAVVVSSSSHVHNFPPTNLVIHPSDNDNSCLHEISDWRADRRQTIAMPDMPLWTLPPQPGNWEWSKGGKKNREWREYSTELSQVLESCFCAFSQTALLEITQKQSVDQSPFASIDGEASVDHYEVSMWSDLSHMKQRNLKTGYTREVRRSGVHDLVCQAHWLQFQLGQAVQPRAFGFRCTSSAKCHTNAPYSWRLEGRLGADVPWIVLHSAGKAPSCDVGVQRWLFDLDRFQNGDVPGETRVYDLNETGSAEYDTFRWVFLDESNQKGFPIQLSGVFLYGNTNQ